MAGFGRSTKDRFTHCSGSILSGMTSIFLGSSIATGTLALSAAFLSCDCSGSIVPFFSGTVHTMQKHNMPEIPIVSSLFNIYT
jgi:hypothetical protein